MPKFLFDTDHLTLYEHNLPQLVRRVAAGPSGDVAISPVSVEEAVRGRLAVLARRLNSIQRIKAYGALVETVQAFCNFPVVPFNPACENQFQQLLRLRLRVGTPDLKIASVALVNQLTLLTRNRRDFARVPGIVLDDWST